MQNIKDRFFLLMRLIFYQKFNHKNLPYPIGDHPSLVTSYHGFGDEPITLHSAIRSKTQATKKVYSYLTLKMKMKVHCTCVIDKEEIIEFVLSILTHCLWFILV